MHTTKEGETNVLCLLVRLNQLSTSACFMCLITPFSLELHFIFAVVVVGVVIIVILVVFFVAVDIVVAALHRLLFLLSTAVNVITINVALLRSEPKELCNFVCHSLRLS